MLPFMPETINKKSKQISVFGGINRSDTKSDNELTNASNMSCEKYPCLCSAKSAAEHTKTDMTINGAIDYNGLFYTTFEQSTGKLYANHNGETTLIGENTSNDSRYFAGMSDNILIMPDKVMYSVSEKSTTPLTDTQNFDVNSAIERAHSQMPGISSSIPKGVATLTSSKIISNTLVYGVYSSYMFCPKKLKQDEFIFVKMQITSGDSLTDEKYNDLIKTLAEGMFIKITGITSYFHSIIDDRIEDVYSIDFEGGINISEDDTMTITQITVEKRLPDLTHICTYGNRIWGVEKNSIRCSRLGDGSVWEDFSADSFGTLPSACFSLEVDSGGEFTAICEYNGNIMAFKENCVHKIYGTHPENYTLQTQSLKGVQKGAGDTLVNINGVLYYKSIDGFYTYNGGVPVCISDKLDNNFRAIYSATDGINYFTIIERDTKREILIYNTRFRIWHSKNADGVFMLLYSANSLHTISANSIQKLNADSCYTKWKFEFEFDENTFYQKRYMRLLLDYDLKKNGYFKTTAIYDDNHVLNFTSGDYTVSPNGESIINLPFVKCRKINIVFEGSGDFTLKKLTREYILLKEGGK